MSRGEWIGVGAVVAGLLGDRIRPGWEAAAGIGLLVAICGAVALARLREIPETAGPPPALEPA